MCHTLVNLGHFDFDAALGKFKFQGRFELDSELAA